MIIASGTVIGGDGFGFEANLQAGRIEKIYHSGGVVIEDDVDIGSLTAIDQGVLEPTRIGKSVKIDNCVHIAHNCIIGEMSGIMGAVCIAGSTKLGKRVLVGGDANIKNGLEIADDVEILPTSNIYKSIDKKGTYGSFGYATFPHKKVFSMWLKLLRANC